MYGQAAGGQGSSASALSSAAPDFAPVSGSRAIRIVNPDDANAGLPPTSPPRRPPSSAAAPGSAMGPSSSSNAGGPGAGGPPPSRWSRASAIPSFQPRDHASQPQQQLLLQHDTPSAMGPPPGLGSGAALSARNVTAPVFVPKQRMTGSGGPPGLSTQGPPPPQGGAFDYMPNHPQQGQQPSGYPGVHMMQSQHGSAPGSQNPYAGAHHSPSMNPYSMHPQGMSPAGGPPPALGGPPGSVVSGPMGLQPLPYQPPLYHLYAPALPHISNLSPHHFALHAFFMSPHLREELQRKNEAIRAAPVPLPDASSAEGNLGASRSVKPLPEELHVYHSLIPLEPLGAAGATLADIHPALAPGSATPDARGPNGLGISSTSTMSGEPSKVFGYRTHVYRAVCKLDGKTYALRRLEGFRLQYEAAIALVERWRRVRHPGVVCVREAFTTRAFGDSSIVFVSDYHPLATNLLQEYLHPKPPRIDPRTNRLQPVNMQIPERTLWSYIVQLAGALRAVHRAGLAARCVEASKVLKTGKNRIRIGGCSIFDVLQFDPQQPTSGPGHLSRLARQQAEDLYALGILILQLATNSMSATVNASAIQRSLDLVTRTYSMDLRDLCAWLLDARPRGGSGGSHTEDSSEVFRTVAQLEAILTGLSHPTASLGESNGAASSSSSHSRLSTTSAFSDSNGGPSGWRRGVASNAKASTESKDGNGDKGPQNRCADELDAALNWGDLLEGELMKETENARLVRLVCKLGLINERPEFDHDPRWSETGDRYIIKLFRDYVFHAVDPETGQPVVDLSYILTNLNKLDAGSDEKIVLTSRDEQSCLVVSYRDIKNCIENAFQDLARPR
ncbi:PAB-dependent poly(A)-specific ribonuclease subunit 3 [Tilletia horrida]|uniref:PAN2-PAN3 deadenylation complex subunit PAN3 n=1 Tax=Tilletia horrida TaxID=155126 RepID=A0AAN6G3W3_9BASI|nr:PAB-dependent poly(A)-specific ribonuclease subunit 3 [Tilletia horrida]